MAVLDPALVKSGKVVPKPGDYVNGYAYVKGDPRSNESYQPLQGQAYLASIAPDRARMALSILSGRAPYPTLSRNNKFNQQIIQDVLAAEPGFDAVAYGTRKKFIDNMTSGNLATLIRALNQAPQHMLALSGAYDKLNNSDTYHFMNDMATNAEAGMGNFHNQAGARGQFNAALQPVAEELNTVFTGKPATVAGAEGQRNVFPIGAGPSESNNALSTTAELLMDRLNTIDTQINNGLGSSRHLFQTISPQARQAVTQLYQRTHPGWEPPAAPVATPAWQTPTGISAPAPKPAAGTAPSVPSIAAPANHNAPPPPANNGWGNFRVHP